MFKKSSNPRVEELNKSCKERSCNLGVLKPIKITDSSGKIIRKCAWCTEDELFHGNQKYCSIECSTSAAAWAYPQKEDGLKCLLLRQEWKCASCQFDYKPFMDKIMEYDTKRYGGTYEPNRLPWHYFKRLKRQVPKERKPEVDHIIPIYKGGQSLGLDNHQAICYDCHKKKTSKDLKV